MDSFFVSCEKKNNPNLQNKLIAIAKEYKRSIASSMSSELKKMGFKAGDSIQIIKSKVKNLVVVEPHYELYTSVAHDIFNLLKNTFSNVIEIYSIDECFLEIFAQDDNFALKRAKEIQDTILEKIKIPCSIGISYSKFLAKMSTNKAKPHGIILTNREDIEPYFYDLKVEKIFGIGNNTAIKLNAGNIFTYRDLVNFNNKPFLRSIFGKNAEKVINELKGDQVNDKLIINADPQGIGNSMTFMEMDIENESELIKSLEEIIKTVAYRLQSQNLQGNVFCLQIRNNDKKWESIQKKVQKYTNDYATIYKIAKELFYSFWKEDSIRGLGFRVSNLKTIFDENYSIDLFDNVKEDKIEDIIFSINYKLGKQVLKKGSQFVLEQKAKPKSIKFLKEDYWKENATNEIKKEK